MTIHKINPDRESSPNQDAANSAGDIEDVMGFTNGVDGSVDFKATKTIDPESPHCYAKRVTISGEGGTRYKLYVKFGLDGFMYNPWGLYSEGTNNKMAKHSGKMAWAFRQVNDKSFSYYLDFLRTRNTAWLNNAERETRNG
tara:strand:- start:67 stop:489 length:423 start_codon:yes stop_codon:yes gene_type:complete